MREKLIENHIKLAYKIAHKYKNKGIELSDLKSESIIHLIRAVDVWDSSKSKLSTLVYHYVTNGLRNLFRKKNVSLKDYKEEKTAELNLILKDICIADIEEKLFKFKKYDRILLCKRFGLLGENHHSYKELKKYDSNIKSTIFQLIKRLKKEFPKCKHCGKLFVKNKKTRKHCSKQCQISNKKNIRFNLKIKSCEICGTSFRPKMKKSVVCSKKCGIKRYNLNKKIKKIERKCDFCGKLYLQTRSTKLYCNRNCSFKHYFQKNKNKIDI